MDYRLGKANRAAEALSRSSSEESDLNLCIKFLSAERTSSLRYFSSRDMLQKKTSKPRKSGRRCLMAGKMSKDVWIIKACLTLLRSSELSWLASHFGIKKTRKLILLGLQYLTIPAYCGRALDLQSLPTPYLARKTPAITRSLSSSGTY